MMRHKCINCILNNSRFSKVELRNYLSTSFFSVKERNLLFDKEKERQRQTIGRLEKIEVKYKGVPQDAVLIMNKGLSTPFNCAQHMSGLLVERSALASVNGKLWDMHRPIEENCELQLHHFRESDPFLVNKAFWRTCSFLLGATITKLFKDEVTVKIHSFPSPNVRSGSFVYDVDLSLNDWKPTKDELRVISASMVKLTHNASQSDENLKIERLEVDENIALEMFSENEHKREQIPSIASSSNEKKVILYRFQDHIDISRGPLIANSGFIGRCTIAAVHPIQSEKGNLYRFQGVALPKGIMINHFSYGILEERAKTFNPVWIPGRSREVKAATA